MNRLANQSILITGGGSGLGYAIAKRCLQEGAQVTVLDKSEQAALSLHDEFGDDILTHVGDVRSIDDNETVVDKCLQRYGHLDCAIGNAGIWDYSMALIDLPEASLPVAF